MPLIKLSGTKGTVRKEVKFSPPPIRKVHKHGRGRRHTHAKVPRGVLGRLLKRLKGA